MSAASDDTDKSQSTFARWRPAYAESSDGVAWTKPNLGLVELAVNTNNNLVRMQSRPVGCVNLKVLLAPEETDPDRMEPKNVAKKLASTSSIPRHL